MTERNENTQAEIRFTLNKHERLKRKKHIDTLFSIGKAYSAFPITIKYILVEKETEECSPTLAGFSVSKKKFKHAVKRNRIKRLIREAWRLHKHQLGKIPSSQQLHIFFIYNDKELTNYSVVETAVIKCIEKLNGILRNA